MSKPRVSKPHVPRTDLIWVPGEGPSAAAIQRLRARFPRPIVPMGEAWFMGEKRKMYDSMLDGSDTDFRNFGSDALWEMATGLTSFGPIPEWTEWLHYLLGRLPELADDPVIFAYYSECITAFMSHYPLGVSDDAKRYPVRTSADLDRDFADDVLATLGRVNLISKHWQSHFDPAKPAINEGFLLSAALLLMIKYLADEDLPTWWRSVIAIDNPVWRTNLIVWLASVSPIFIDPAAQPAQFDQGSAAGWNPCYALKGKYIINVSRYVSENIVAPFLPAERQQAMCSLLRQTLTPEILFAWVMEFETLPAAWFYTEPVQPVSADYYLLDAADRCVTAYALSDVN